LRGFQGDTTYLVLAVWLPEYDDLAGQIEPKNLAQAKFKGIVDIFENILYFLNRLLWSTPAAAMEDRMSENETRFRNGDGFYV